jgi:hypothetical protein
MASRTRRLTGLAVAGLLISAAAPATSALGASLAPCRAVSQSTGSEVAVVLEGSYTDKAGGDVFLTCYLVQNGVRVASVRDPLVGPVAALVSDQRLGTAPFSVCYTVSVHSLDPWGPYFYDSNC